MVTLEQSERNRKTRLFQAYDRAPDSLLVHQAHRRCRTQEGNFHNPLKSREDGGPLETDLPPLWRARLGDTLAGPAGEKSYGNRDRFKEYAHRLMVSLDSEPVL